LAGTDDKALVNFASAATKAAAGSFTNRFEAATKSARADPTSASTLSGVGGERAVEKAFRLRHAVGIYTLVEPSQALKIEVHRIGGRRLFRAPRLGGEFECMGDKPPQDHPHIYLNMGDASEIVCPYCSTLFRFDPTLGAREADPVDCAYVGAD
jgi:hypothetical protein